MKIAYYIFAFGILNLMAGCDEVRQNDEIEYDTLKVEKKVETPEKPTEKEPAAKKPAETKLKFSSAEKFFIKTYDTISFGTNFKKIRQTFPAVKGIRPEGGSDELAAQGLTESQSKVVLLNKEGFIDFNFKNDSLYSYYLTVKEDNYDKAEKLYEYIHDYYSKEYGDCKKERVEEENRFVRTCMWNLNDRHAVMTYSINEGTISWGFQAQKP